MFNFIRFEYAIGVGHNNVPGLVNVQSIAATGEPQYQFYDAPLAVPGYSPGIRRVRLDGLDYFVGNETVRWLFGMWSWYQYDFWSETYCDGGYSGLVTIRTRIGRRAYANFNATCHLPTPVEMRAVESQEYWEDVNVDMTDLELIPEA